LGEKAIAGDEEIMTLKKRLNKFVLSWKAIFSTEVLPVSVPAFTGLSPD
jgi:hypothetical protein